MNLTVDNVAVLDPFHHNGDEFWDGDQTLYELDIVDGDACGSILAVVPRGNAFITPRQVKRYVEQSGRTLTDFRDSARRPGPNRRAQVVLPIEPGDL